MNRSLTIKTIKHETDSTEDLLGSPAARVQPFQNGD